MGGPETICDAGSPCHALLFDGRGHIDHGQTKVCDSLRLILVMSSADLDGILHFEHACVTLSTSASDLCERPTLNTQQTTPQTG